MKKVKKGVYFQTAYSGATLGALLFPQDTVLVDAPLRPEDGRAWLAALKEAGASPRRILVNLDAHPDRTLGAQTLAADVLAHEEIVRQLRRRAGVFKALRQETGAEWEQTPGLSGLRWIMPRITFSDTASLHFAGTDLRIEPRPGPGPGACWLLAPEQEVVFVGDALTLGEPPFLAQADIPAWLESLEALLSRHYREYAIICGRGGKATPREIKQMASLLKDLHGKLRGISRGRNAAVEMDKLAARIAERFKPTHKQRPFFVQRLRHGMQEYAARHFPSRRK